MEAVEALDHVFDLNHSLSPFPKSAQVRDGLRRLIITGAIPPGDRLPSVRAMAGQLAIFKTCKRLLTNGFDPAIMLVYGLTDLGRVSRNFSLPPARGKVARQSRDG